MDVIRIANRHKHIFTLLTAVLCTLISCQDSAGSDDSVELSSSDQASSSSAWTNSSSSSLSYVSSSSTELVSSSSSEASGSSSSVIQSSASSSSSVITGSSDARDCTFSEVNSTQGQLQCAEKSYATVTITADAITQTWMAENLAWLPSVNGLKDSSSAEPKYYVHGYDGQDVQAAKATEKYATYGALYNYPAALNACPTGWHLPTEMEWSQLLNTLGGFDQAGIHLKAVDGWPGSSTKPGQDTYGFAALPGGSFAITWFSAHDMAYFWTSSPWGDSYGYYYLMAANGAYVDLNGAPRNFGLSIRCLKN